MQRRAGAIRRQLARNGAQTEAQLVATLERAVELVDAGRFHEQLVLPDGQVESALACVGRFRLERFVDIAPD
jgi:hypothetical protein